MTTNERQGATPADAVLSALSDERRRVVLRVLERADGETVAFDGLVEQVLEAERSGGEESTPGDHRRRVRTALHHVHLPKLDACGLIDHDTETNRVRTEADERSRELLAVVESDERNRRST